MTKRQPPGPTLNTAQPGLSRARRLAPDGPAHKVTDFYYFSNGFHAVRSVVQPIDQVVSLQRSNPDAVPYRLDAWTGDVERIATFEEDGPDQIRVRVALRPGETTIIALGRRAGTTTRPAMVCMRQAVTPTKCGSPTGISRSGPAGRAVRHNSVQLARL